MKNTLKMALLIAAITGLTTTGCFAPSVGSPMTDPQFVANAELFIKAGTANGVIVAVNNSPESKAYITLVRAALRDFVGGSSYNPTDLENALMALPVPAIQNFKYSQMVITDISMAYELYYGDLIRNNMYSDATAQGLITAAINGIDLGLAGKTQAAVRRPTLTKPHLFMKQVKVTR